jgi:hypothetical protein
MLSGFKRLHVGASMVAKIFALRRSANGQPQVIHKASLCLVQ